MSEPTTAAGQYLYEGIALRGQEAKAARHIVAIEAEAREQAWAEISSRYVTHAEEAQRRVEAVAEARREALREAREAVAALFALTSFGAEGQRITFGAPMIEQPQALAAIDALMGGSPK